MYGYHSLRLSEKPFYNIQLIFSFEGIDYQLKGSKENIRISDFVHSHSLCIGEVIRLDEGTPITTFVMHFFWEDLLPFAKSLRIVSA